MRRVLILASAAVVALVVWLLLPGAKDDAPRTARDDAARSVPARLEGQPTATTESAAAVQGAPVDESEVTPKPPPPFQIRATSEDGGRGIEGVKITLRRGNGESRETGPDGMVAIELPNPGIQAASFLAAKSGYLPTGGVASRAELNVVRMRPAVRVSGRVLRATDDAPVEGAVVRAWTVEGWSETCAAATTDADGRFTLDAVTPRARVRVVARAPGQHAVAVMRTFPEDETDLVILVGRGGTLEGLVRRDDGTPAAGVEVMLRPPGVRLLPTRSEAMTQYAGLRAEFRDFYYPTVEADAGGRYAIHGIPLGKERLPVARLTRLANVPAEVVLFARDGETLLRDIELPALGSITVRVLDADGRALPDVQVDFTSPLVSFDLRAEGRKNEDGSRTVEGLVPGPWTLRAWVPAGKPVDSEVVLEAGGHPTVVLGTPDGLVLEGQVVDARGRPVPYADVSFSGPTHRSATADESGTFRLTGLPDASGVLEATPGFETPESLGRPLARARLAGVRPGREKVRLVLPDGGWLSGRFRSVQAGTDLGMRRYSHAENYRSNLVLSRGGTFRIPAPRAGFPFLLCFSGSERGAAFVEVPALDVGEDKDLGTLDLGAGSVLEGRMLDANGAAVSRARVRLVEPWLKRDVRTEEEGDFAFHALPPFPVAVRVDAPGFPPALRMLDPRVPGPHEIRVSRGSAVEVQVLDHAGAPLTEGSLSIEWAVTSPYCREIDGLREFPRLDPSGTTRLRLEAATYRLRAVTSDGDEMAEATIDVRDGETATHEIRLTSVSR